MQRVEIGIPWYSAKKFHLWAKIPYFLDIIIFEEATMVSFVKLLSFMSLEMYIETFFLVFQRILSSHSKEIFFFGYSSFSRSNFLLWIQHKLNYNDVKRFFLGKNFIQAWIGPKNQAKLCRFRNVSKINSKSRTYPYQIANTSYIKQNVYLSWK